MRHFWMSTYVLNVTYSSMITNHFGMLLNSMYFLFFKKQLGLPLRHSLSFMEESLIHEKLRRPLTGGTKKGYSNRNYIA